MSTSANVRTCLHCCCLLYLHVFFADSVRSLGLSRFAVPPLVRLPLAVSHSIARSCLSTCCALSCSLPHLLLLLSRFSLRSRCALPCFRHPLSLWLRPLTPRARSLLPLHLPPRSLSSHHSGLLTRWLLCHLQCSLSVLPLSSPHLSSSSLLHLFPCARAVRFLLGFAGPTPLSVLLGLLCPPLLRRTRYTYGLLTGRTCPAIPVTRTCSPSGRPLPPSEPLCFMEFW